MASRAKAKVTPNDAGIRELLRHATAQDVTARARRVASAAGPGYEVRTFVGRNRFRATVATTDFKSMVSEAKHHKLLRALDAGRG